MIEVSVLINLKELWSDALPSFVGIFLPTIGIIIGAVLINSRRKQKKSVVSAACFTVACVAASSAMFVYMAMELDSAALALMFWGFVFISIAFIMLPLFLPVIAGVLIVKRRRQSKSFSKVVIAFSVTEAAAIIANIFLMLQ